MRGRERNEGDKKTEDSKMQEQQSMRKSGDLEIESEQSKRSPEYKTEEQM